MLAGATGQRLRAWNGRGFVYRSSYDVLRRPTHEHAQPASGSERLARRHVYGEAHPQATALNLRGRPYQVYDGAGVVTSLAHDFKGNLLQASRRLRSDVHADADWSVLAALTDGAAIVAAAEPLLEVESFATQTAYDALNRPTSVTTPDASELRPTYNEAGLLERVEARVRGAAAWTTFVDDIDYDARGQRERIDHGNGTSTAYTYDPLTFRLSRLRTTRSADSAVLQNLTYVYDPAGNIVEIGDSAQQTVFFNNAVVSPSAHYVYDAVYRLTAATGREHASLADVQRDQNDMPIQSLPHANNAQALRNYTEQYLYDAVGNLLRMVHQASAGGWTRRYAYEATSNRLTSTSLPDDPVNGPYSATYAHDEHGNMTAMPHIDELTWDENDQLRSTDLGGGGVVHYTYDAAGQRVRKVWEHSGLVEERIYLGGYEVYRRRNATGLVLERQTLHVMDGARRVAMVETKTIDTSGPFTVTPRLRYQLDNHLGSTSLEVDGAGLVIGYEEYHPYGTTAYWSADSAAEVSRKRYRYTGKEKDEETGLYYHGARYYAPWLGRWTSADPAGMVDGPGLYTYARDNPTGRTDPTGRQSNELVEIDENTVAHFGTGDVAHRGEGYIERYNLSVDDRQVVVFADDPLHANPSSRSTARPPAVRSQETVDSFSDIIEKDEGIASFLEGAIAGGFSENDSWSATAGQVLVGFVPIVGQIADLRDIAAAASKFANGQSGAALEFGMAVVAVVPGLDFLKGGTKAGRKALREAAEEGIEGVAEAGVKRAAKRLSKEGAARAAKELKALSVARTELIARMERMAGDPNVPEALRNTVTRAKNALHDHLTPSDLSGALRDALGLPVRKPGAGEAFGHAEEVAANLGTLADVRKLLLRQLRYETRGSSMYKMLSEQADALAEFAMRADRFLTTR
ncbi:RHS repeat-associated core domain-containing protein [Sorangium sp. So ce1128]